MIDIKVHNEILSKHLSLYPELVRLCMVRMQDRKTKADKTEYLKKSTEHICDSINYFAMEMQREPQKQKMLSPRLSYLAEAIRNI